MAKAPMQGADETEDDGAIGKQRVAPQRGVVLIQQAGRGQHQERQQPAIAQPGDAAWRVLEEYRSF